MLSKRREHREDLRKLLPLIETQRKKLELYKSLKTSGNYMEVINQQSDQLDDFKQQNEYQKTEIENYKKQLKEMTEAKEALNEKTKDMKMDISRILKLFQKTSQRLRKTNQEYEQAIEEMKKKEKKITEEYNQIKEKFDELEREDKHRKIFNERLELMDYYKIGFFKEKNLEFTRNSSSILDKLADRFYKKEIGDDKICPPPLKDIHSLKNRRQEAIGYIEFARINWNNHSFGTDIQQNIHKWFCINKGQFLYKPSEKEKEISRKMFLNKFKLENTIGTIHFLPIQFSNCTFYFCFAITNYIIVHWVCDYSQQETYDYFYSNLKHQRSWTEITKFATEMEVNDEQSDTFIHTSNRDVFVENEKVVTWIKNNFNMEQQNNISTNGFHIIPLLYNFFVNFYDTSFTE